MKGEESLPDTTLREDMADTEQDSSLAPVLVRARDRAAYIAELEARREAARSQFKKEIAGIALEQALVEQFGFDPSELGRNTVVLYQDGDGIATHYERGVCFRGIVGPDSEVLALGVEVSFDGSDFEEVGQVDEVWTLKGKEAA